MRDLVLVRRFGITFFGQRESRRAPCEIGGLGSG